MPDDAISRRRAARERQTRNRLILVGVAILAVCAIGGTVAAVVRGRQRVEERTGGDGPPSASGVAAPSDDWTHADLAADLKKRGVSVTVEGGGAAPAGMLSSVFVETSTGQRVNCHLAQTRQQAREAAASLGPRTLVWGRFVITDRHSENDDLFGRIRNALR